MLIESLTLIQRRILTTEEMVAAVEGAIAAKRQMVKDREHPEISTVAVGVLASLANSLAAKKA